MENVVNFTGVCKENATDGSYTCDCPGGYLTPTCEHRDPCHTNPCQYSGTCDVNTTANPPSAVCSCMDGFR